MLQNEIWTHTVDIDFIVNDPRIDKVPDICLDKDQNNHKRYNARAARARDAFIITSRHGILRLHE